MIISVPNAYAEIPSWIKELAGMWHQDKIDDDEFLNAIEFLIETKVIDVSYLNGPVVEELKVVMPEECLIHTNTKNLEGIKSILVNAGADCRAHSDVGLSFISAVSQQQEDYCYEKSANQGQYNQCYRDVSDGMREIISRHYDVNDFECAKNFEHWMIDYDKCYYIPRIDDWLNLGVVYHWDYIPHDGLTYGPSGFYDDLQIE